MAAAKKIPSDTTITMRIPSAAKKRIEEAAALEGRSVSALMIEAANAHAIEALLDRRVFELSEEGAAAFERVLSDPAPPAEALKRLMKRKAPWE